MVSQSSDTLTIERQPNTQLWLKTACFSNPEISGEARAFPGGRLAHPEGRNEEENEQSLRKNKKNWSRFEEKWGKWNSCPPGTVRLATALIQSITVASSSRFLRWQKTPISQDSFRSCFKTEDSLLRSEVNGVVGVDNGMVFPREVFLLYCCIISTLMTSLLTKNQEVYIYHADDLCVTNQEIAATLTLDGLTT